MDKHRQTRKIIYKKSKGLFSFLIDKILIV